MNLKFIPDDIVDGYAIQALATGTATEDQQKRAFNCIVRELCGTYDMTFDPESERVSAFNEGKRHIGRVLVGLLSTNLTVLKEVEKAKTAAKQLTVNKRRKDNG